MFSGKHPLFRVSLILTIALVGLGSVRAVQAQLRTFPDVQTSTEAGRAIQHFTALNVLRGYQSGLFGPNDPVTRAQAALMLYRFEKSVIQPLQEDLHEVRVLLGLEEDETSATPVQPPAPVTPAEPIIPEPTEPTEPTEPLTPVITPSTPLCGNGICEYHENTLPPDRRFYCPQDCTGKPVVRECDAMQADLKAALMEPQSCTTTEDCTLLGLSCPFLTCEKSVSQRNYPSLKLQLDATLETCRREGVLNSCLFCPASVAVCEQGQCVAKQK